MNDQEKAEFLNHIGAFKFVKSTSWGKAEPEDFKEVAIYITKCAKNGQTLPAWIVKYLGDAFTLYLGGKSLESAFGAKRGKGGRPKDEKSVAISIARTFLKHRIVGLSWDDAVTATSSEVHKSKSVVQAAWKENKASACLTCTPKNLFGRSNWTAAEATRLDRILKGVNKELQLTYGDVHFVSPLNDSDFSG